jgi:PQQ-like domain/IPT/TIG domain
MATRLLRRLRWRTTALLGLVAGLGLCLGVAAPAAPATAAALTAPSISSFTPATGPAGTAVTITGANFTGATAVKFGGVGSVFTVTSASQITAGVPAMPSSAGPITVTTPGGTAKSTANFTVTPQVLLKPATGPPGSAVTVSGTGFGAFEGVDIFFDTTDEALAGTSAAGSFGPITVTVPAAATPGTHWISAAGRHSGLFAQAAFTVNTDWAQFRDTRKHKGYNPYENVLNTGTVGQIDKDAYLPTGGGVDSSPAVAGGTVYVGSGDHNVYALTTSAQLWTFTTGGFVFSSPAVAGGVVYVGSEDGNVYALNAGTGAPLWHFPTGGPVFSSPAVAGGGVDVGSDDHNVYALNAATGAPLWNFTTGYIVESSPAVADGVVYAGSWDGNLYALNAATGARLWSYTTGAIVDSSPAVTNGVVYAGSDDGNLYAFDLAGGLAAPARPSRSSLHPNYHLREQRGFAVRDARRCSTMIPAAAAAVCPITLAGADTDASGHAQAFVVSEPSPATGAI